MTVLAHLFLKDRLNLYLSDIGTNLWGMGIIAIVPMMIIELNENILKTIGKRIYTYLMSFLSSSTIFLILLYFIGNNELSAETAIGVWVLTASLVSFIYLIITWCIVGHEIMINYPLILKSIVSGFKPYVVNLFVVITIHLDLILIAYFMTIQDVGKYSVALVLSGITHRFAWVLKGFIPSVRKNPQISTVPSPLHLRLSLNLALLSGVVIIFLSWYLIRHVIGLEFLNSYVVLLILIPGFVFLSQSRLVLKHYLKKGEYFYVISIASTAFILFFGLNLVLIPVYGINGAAVAFTLTQFFSWITFLYMYNRKVNSKILDLLIIKKGDLVSSA